jgi:hypothetical protein
MRTYGAKFDAALTPARIAARVRADIKAAVTSGDLPGGIYTVRPEKGSPTPSINVTAQDLQGIRIYSVARLLADRDAPHVYSGISWMSAEASRLESALQWILDAYNGADTESTSVRFYGVVEIRGDREAEMASLPPKSSPEAAALRLSLRTQDGAPVEPDITAHLSPVLVNFPGNR